MKQAQLHKHSWQKKAFQKIKLGLMTQAKAWT